MKKGLLLGALLLGSIFVTGCNNNQTQVKIDEKFQESYLEQNSLKGIEVYVWEVENDGFNCVLMSGTNRIKTVDEIKKLQDELPCPITVMKEILKTYEDVNEITYVALVSNPVKQEELNHEHDTDELKSNEKFQKVLASLGIDESKYSY